MKETYIRPWWKSLFYYFLCCVGLTAVSSAIVFFMLWGLYGDPFFTIEGTIFGTTTMWFVESFAFATLSPVLGFVIYFGLIYRKYDYEWKKLGLIPVDPEDSDRVLFEPRKIEGKEPLWKENTEFEATISLHGTQNLSTGRGWMTWMVVVDESGYKYLMMGHRFNEILSKMTDGKYHGKFKFDTTWKYPSLRIVE